jgi:multidrug efflux pump subunit AcrB
MNFLILAGFLSFGGLYFIVLNQTKNRLNLFLNNYVEISDRQALNAYKALARYCMYHALVGIGAMLGVFLLSVFLVMTPGSRVFPFGFSLMIWMGVSGKNSSNLEKKTQSLPCANRQFESQYQRITETWKKKALPDF